jgi:putative FmdB family regulatory protein
MPIYEYRCSSCGHEKEVLQKMSDAPLAECPACGKSSFRKLISAAGFQLKGSGWYATDFKGGPRKSGEDKKSGEDSGKPAATENPGSGEESKAKQESKPKEESKSDASGSGSGATTA